MYMFLNVSYNVKRRLGSLSMCVLKMVHRLQIMSKMLTLVMFALINFL